MSVNVIKIYVGATGNGDSGWAPAGRYSNAAGNFFGIGSYLWSVGTTVCTLNGTSTDGSPPTGAPAGSPPLTIGTVTAGIVQAFAASSYVTSAVVNGVNWRSQIAAQESLMDAIGLAPGAHRTSFATAVQALSSFTAGTQPTAADTASLIATVATLAPTAILTATQVALAYTAWLSANWANIP